MAIHFESIESINEEFEEGFGNAMDFLDAIRWLPSAEKILLVKSAFETVCEMNGVDFCMYNAQFLLFMANVGGACDDRRDRAQGNLINGQKPRTRVRREINENSIISRSVCN